ncbi:MAG: PEP-CTERM sorting domain-containing protein [Planctomycetaceae bacterium]
MEQTMVIRAISWLSACVVLAGTANADIMFSLVPVGPTTVSQGTSVTIQIVATNPTPDLIGQTWLAFGAQIVANTGDANDAPIQMVGPKFDPLPAILEPPTIVRDFDAPQETMPDIPAGRTFTAFAKTGAILADGDVLASFTYVADVVGTTTFSFNSVPGFNSADLNDGLLDFSITTDNGLAVLGTAITVTAVPEPSSFALLGLIGAGVFVVRSRRRKPASVKYAEIS